MSAEPFVVYDCSLVRRATGQWVSNLRELLVAVQHMDDLVLEHHMTRCPLDDWFMLEEFPNDLARWCWRDLKDRATGERLALIDPYRHPSHDSLRKEIIEIIEDRLWDVGQAAASCPPGMEFHLVGSQLVAYETGVRLETMAALAENLPRMSLRSLFYHVHDARRRSGGETDDFSTWLEAAGADPQLVRGIRAIDFYFMNLRQLQATLMGVFQTHFAAFHAPAAPPGDAAPAAGVPLPATTYPASVLPSTPPGAPS